MGYTQVRQAEAHVVVRLNPATLRTCDAKHRRIFLQQKEGEVPPIGAVEFDITIPIPPPASRSHKTWDSAKAIAWVEARAIAARTRRQIELLFKRLKSLLHLDTLPSRQGSTAKSWMLARLIAAALAQRLVQPSGPLSPWGYELRSEPVDP